MHVLFAPCTVPKVPGPVQWPVILCAQCGFTAAVAVRLSTAALSSRPQYRHHRSDPSSKPAQSALKPDPQSPWSGTGRDFHPLEQHTFARHTWTTTPEPPDTSVPLDADAALDHYVLWGLLPYGIEPHATSEPNVQPPAVSRRTKWYLKLQTQSLVSGNHVYLPKPPKRREKPVYRTRGQ